MLRFKFEVRQTPIPLLDILAATGGASLHARGRVSTAALLNELPCDLDGPVLELGCGTGETTVQICRHAGFVVGTDISTPMIRTARDRARWCGVGRRLATIKGPTNGTLPFATNAFGAIVIESVLAIQSNEVLRRLVGEVHRVIQPHGRVLVNETVWLPTTPRETAAEINRRAASSLGLIQAILDPFDAKAWVKMFSYAGFNLIKQVLVDELPETRSRPAALAWILLRSRAFTLWRRLASTAASGGIGNRRQLNRVLSKLAPKSPCLEGRIFVLEPRATP
jgi:ubiquinone/menaquinone biosynthesis C-methylase UbiE